MKTETTNLKNGSKIIGIKMTGAKSVVINFGFRTGSRNEQREYAGISHFLEHMMFKGSEKRPTAALIAKDADRIGATYNAFTGEEYTCYYIKTIKNNFELSLDIVGDMVTRPLLKNAEIKKESGTIIEEIKMYNDNPMINIFGKMKSTLYGTHTPFGRDIAGTPKTVKNINSNIMKKYFKENYNGQNCTLVIAGDLPNNYIKMASKYLNRLEKGNRSQWEVPKISSLNNKIIKQKTEQAHFGICIPAYKIDDKNTYAAEIIVTALGGYMSSRLFTEIREKRGWAYRIGAFNDQYSDNGYLGIFGGIKKDKIIDAIEIVKKEVENFPKNITDEEIERSKGHILGSSVLKYDDPEERAKHAVLMDLLSEKKESPEKFVKKISEVKNAEVREIANNLLNSKDLFLTVIGPFKDKEKFAKILNH